MSSVSPVLVIDDGELASLRALLDELGAEVTHSGSADAAGMTPPSRLLVVTAKAAHALRLERPLAPSPDRATWIAFVSGDSKTQRNLLQKAGFDFLVREPVHPAALRVLLQRALFRGSDTRRAPRVAFGCLVRYRTGFWRRTATLVDLSPRGCRLLVSGSLKEKTAIRVQLPRELAGGKSLELSGHAVRVAPASREGGVAREFSVGVRFGTLNEKNQKRLRAALAERVIGPSSLGQAVPFAPTPAESRPPAASTPPPRRKRVNRRAKFRRQITAVEGKDSYMILCLDLSVGGMRIEPVEGLTKGAKLNLAIQLAGPREPVMVETTVVRDEGENGLALRFDWLSQESRGRIERLLATLPAIEPLQDEARRQGTILATRLQRSPRPK